MTPALPQAQAGTDPHDPFSTAPVTDLDSPLEQADLGSIRAMITPDLGSAAMSHAYSSIFADRTSRFRIILPRQSMPVLTSPMATTVSKCCAGSTFVAAHGARVRDHRDSLSPNVVDNVDRGLAYSLADAAKAHLQQSRIARAWLDLFEDIDVVICPAASSTPFPMTSGLSAKSMARRWKLTCDGLASPTCQQWPLPAHCASLWS